MRLFVAIPLQASQAALSEVAARYRSKVRASWVDRTKLHLTLRFIGEVSGKTDGIGVSRLTRELEAIQFASFEIEVAGLGVFPPRGKARVLWAGVHPEPRECGDPLKSLASAVASAADAAGLTEGVAGSGSFRPHITLARARGTGDLRSLHELVHPSQPYFGAERVERFVLLESRPVQGKYSYFELHSFPAEA